VHWADAVIVATPIRWGAASSLYFKMAERLNCVQNAITTRNKVLIRNKVAGFIIVGGQDNIQSVAGQMLGFFAELGFLFPQFPYVAHSRGWSHEDMERNVEILRASEELKEGAAELAGRCLALARRLIDSHEMTPEHIMRGGREALSARSGERVGPIAKQWEGEVFIRGATAFVFSTHLTLPSPPAGGRRGSRRHLITASGTSAHRCRSGSWR